MVLSALCGVIFSVLLSRMMAGRSPNWLFVVTPLPIVVGVLGWRFIIDLIGPRAGTAGLLLTVLGGMSSVILPLVKGTSKEETKSLKLLISGLGLLTVCGSFLLAVDRSHSSERQAQLVIGSARETMDFFSGGDGFCYLDFPTVRSNKVPIRSHGDYVQHVIFMHAFPVFPERPGEDKRDESEIATKAGDMLVPPFAEFVLNQEFKYQIPQRGHEMYIVKLTMRNGLVD